MSDSNNPMDKVFQFHLSPEKRYEEILSGRWTHLDAARGIFVKAPPESKYLHVFDLKGELPSWVVLYILEKELIPSEAILDGGSRPLTDLTIFNATDSYRIKGL